MYCAMKLLATALLLLLAEQTAAVELRRELAVQGVRFHQGHVSDLADDELFTMKWTANSSDHANVKVPLVEDDNCTSFEGKYRICYLENPEHDMVRKWIPADATVMEFGARFGTTTCEIAKALQNSGKVVSIEPDEKVWSSLESNIKSHNCQARVLRGAVSGSPTELLGSGYGGRSQSSTWSSWLLSTVGVQRVWTVPTYTFDAVEEASGLKFDTLLIDCEGCAQDLMDQIGPKLKNQIKLIILEADAPDTLESDCTSNCMDYNKFFSFLADNGFHAVDSFNDCDRTRNTAPEDTYCARFITHFAFKRK